MDPDPQQGLAEYPRAHRIGYMGRMGPIVLSFDHHRPNINHRGGFRSNSLGWNAWNAQTS